MVHGETDVGTRWLDLVGTEIFAAVRETGLALEGLAVLTEAATGAFAVTPVIAALAGARRVLAVSRTTRYGTASQAFSEVERLAVHLGVAGRVEYAEGRPENWFSLADIVTNSGHVRPLDAASVDRMKPTGVISLMYEGWEWRPEDVDLEACDRRGVVVAGVSERHPAVNVFSYLGPAALQLAVSGGLTIEGRRVLLVCDNPFLPHLEETFRLSGAKVEVVGSLCEADAIPPADLVLLALKPDARLAVSAREAYLLARFAPGATLVQFWGDVDREALSGFGVAALPEADPGKGRMGILLSDLGPKPAIRLQTGGLKVGELLARARQKDPSREGLAGALNHVVKTGYGMLPPLR